LNVQNSNRARTKLIVSLFPGIHLRKLQKLLGTSFSTTRYHVASLERDGEIVRSRYGRYDRLYSAGTVESAKAAYAVLQGKTARKVLQVLVEDNSEAFTNGDLSGRTHLTRSAVSDCTRYLCGINLVRRSVKADGRVVYEARDKEEILRLLAIFQKNLMNLAADRFIDLWDV